MIATLSVNLLQRIVVTILETFAAAVRVRKVLVALVPIAALPVFEAVHSATLKLKEKQSTCV